MKRQLIIIATVLLVLGLVSFRNNPKPQFFVIGHVDYSAPHFDYYVSGKNVKFDDRHKMLSYMNSLGYRCISMSFNTYRSQGQEYYIFE